MCSFYNVVSELKSVSEKEVTDKVKAIWEEYLDPNSAPFAVNIDSKCMDKTKKEVHFKPSRHTYDDARVSTDHAHHSLPALLHCMHTLLHYHTQLRL